MKWILISLITFSGHAFELSATEKNIKNESQIRNVVEKYSKSDLENILRQFVRSGMPTRLVGTKGHDLAFDFIKSYLNKNIGNLTSVSIQEFSPDISSAIKMYEDDFNKEVSSRFSPMSPDYQKWSRFTKATIEMLNAKRELKGKNLIWEKKGSVNPDEVIVLGAHYDTLANDPATSLPVENAETPGADNNGTGVALLLAMTDILSQIDMPKTVRIVFFDFEEMGFLGSKYFAEDLATHSKEKVWAMINVLMLGNDSKLLDSEKRLGNFQAFIRKSSEKGSAMDEYVATRLNSIGKLMSSSISFDVMANSMNSSSHINFWKQGFPAVVYTQNWDKDFNSRYHTSNDFPETLNYQTYYQAFKYITGGVLAHQLGIEKKL